MPIPTRDQLRVQCLREVRARRSDPRWTPCELLRCALEIGQPPVDSPIFELILRAMIEAKRMSYTLSELDPNWHKGFFERRDGAANE